MLPKKMAVYLLVASILLTSCAQLLMKTGMTGLGEFSFNLHFLQQLLVLEKVGPLLFVFFGLACYGFSMIAWIGVLTRIELSVAYPFLSISYILVYLAATSLPWFNESISIFRLSGIIFICIGLFMITRSHSSKKKDIN